MNTIHSAGHSQTVWHPSIEREITFKAALIWFLSAGLIVDTTFAHLSKESGSEIDQIQRLQGSPLAVQLTNAADIIYNKFYREGSGCAILSNPSLEACGKLVQIDRYQPGLEKYRVHLRGSNSASSSEQSFLVYPQHLRPHETSHSNNRKSKLQTVSHCVSLTSDIDPHQKFRLEFWCFQFDLFRPSFEVNTSQSNLQNLLDDYHRSVNQHNVRLSGKKRRRDLTEHQHLEPYSATDFSNLLVISALSRISIDLRPLSQGLGLLDRNNLGGADFQEKIIQGVALFGRLSIYRASMVTLDDGRAINDQILNFLLLW